MSQRWRRRRRDLAVAAGVALIIALGWSLEYSFLGEHRLTDPISYRGDALFAAASIAAARRGDFLPIASKVIDSLGAPFQASWNDFPFTEDWIIFLIGLLAKAVGTIAAVNLGYVFAAMMNGVSMYAVTRQYRLPREGGAFAGILYGLASYLFVRSVHHYTLCFFWMVPWNVLVSSWLASRKGIPLRSRRFAIAAVTTVITAWGFVYYSFFAAQLFVLGSVSGLLRNGRKFTFWPAAALAAIMGVAVGLVNLDSILWVRANGPNSAVLARNPTDIEQYALKPVNFFVSGHLHRWEFMRTIWRHATEQTMIGGEHPGAYLGMVGGACLLGLGVYVMWMLARGKADRAVGWAATVAWLIVGHSVGGLNSVMGLTGFRLFRSVNRVSVVILAVVLLFGAWMLPRLLRRLPARVRWAALVLLAVAGCYEQIPMTDPQDDIARMRRVAEADRKLVAAMEANLPKGSSVYELPVMDFPEVPPHYGVDGYELFRPYFYADTLKFSHGDVKGRPNALWKFRVEGLPVPQLVAELKKAGFSGIYVNRKGYADGGEGLVRAFLENGCRLIAVSEVNDTLALAL